MKKHQACYWLNVIADEIRRSIAFHEEEAEKARDGDTEDRVDARRKYGAERVCEYEKQLQAIDLAGEALTK